MILFSNEEIVFVNNAFASMFGYTEASQILGKKVGDLFAPGFKAQFRNMYQDLIDGATDDKTFQPRWVTGRSRVASQTTR